MARQPLYLALANLLIPVAVVVFAIGFFPYKPSIPGLAKYEQLGWEEKMGWTEEPEPQFNKVVFMVVDALRSDFVFGRNSAMHFVQSLIRDGSAIPFTAHATSPTITQPRVKAMTTGSVPSFLDMILSFMESDTTGSLASQDTWLAQMRAKDGGKLVMYGDDTWLKLFPDFFARKDGTTSFFVSDFVEVDNNVTRNVPGELRNEDWNGMILHYLGLDHIGHKTGPKGPQMLPKQAEMDLMVRQIYAAIVEQEHLSDTLFVLCGDHGMNDAGGHGASSPGETSPALVFMSPKLKKITEFLDKTSPTDPKGDFEYHRKINQADIVPTLAGLLGFPIPKNNLGVFIEEFLHFWAEGSDRINLLLQNAQQMKKIVEKTYPKLDFSDSVQEAEQFTSLDQAESTSGGVLAYKWQIVVQIMSTAAIVHPRIRMDYLYGFLHEAQDTMSTAASNYDVSLLIWGTVLAVLSSVFAYLSLDHFGLKAAAWAGLFYTLAISLYSISMFASSFVEEEHQFWYFMTGTWLLCLCGAQFSKFRVYGQEPAQSSALAMGIVLALHRLSVRWNQTGQKFAGADDIAHWFAVDQRRASLLWLLVGATYITLAIRLSRDIAGLVCAIPLVGIALVFKLAFTSKDSPELTSVFGAGWNETLSGMDLVFLARAVFMGIVGVFGIFAVGEVVRERGKKGMGGQGRAGRRKVWHPRGMTTALDLLTLFLITQTKAQNIPLYLLWSIQAHLLLTTSTLSPTQTTITTLFLAQASYFAMGNNNAISSVDLANAYNGVSGYNAPLVGVLVFVSNWGGPVYWSLFGLRVLGKAGRKVDGEDEMIGGVEKVVSGKEVASYGAEVGFAVKEKGSVTSTHPEAPAAPAAPALPAPPATKDLHSQHWHIWRQHLALLTLWMSVGTAAVMMACTALRTHLFVWSVFSPKFLFQGAWAVVWHLGVNSVVGMGRWAAGAGRC